MMLLLSPDQVLCIYSILKTGCLGGLFTMPFIFRMSSTYLFQTFLLHNIPTIAGYTAIEPEPALHIHVSFTLIIIYHKKDVHNSIHLEFPTNV